MKLFWCEQSGLLEDRSAFVGELKSAGVEFFRLNWRYGSDDPFSNVPKSADKISWSYGRQLLFDHVKHVANKDDYIILADDDVAFLNMSVEDAIEIIKNSLNICKPLCAAVNSQNWHISRFQHVLNRILRKSSYQIFCADLEVQILRRDFADIIFPVAFDGGYGTLWYPYFMNHQITKSGTLCISRLTVTNTRFNPTGNYGGELNHAIDLIWDRCSCILPRSVRWLVKRYGIHLGIIYYNFFISFKRFIPVKIEESELISIRKKLPNHGDL